MKLGGGNYESLGGEEGDLDFRPPSTISSQSSTGENGDQKKIKAKTGTREMEKGSKIETRIKRTCLSTK